MNELTSKERLRRVVLLCCHFTRNLTYYRTGHDRLTNGKYSQLFTTIDGNFLDIAVLEWCKLYGDKRGSQRWSVVVRDGTFEGRLLQSLGLTDAEFSGYVGEMRAYRDKFIAHLDDDRVMDIPDMRLAASAVKFLHNHIVQNEASGGDLTRLPTSLSAYERQCVDEMLEVLDRCNL